VTPTDLWGTYREQWARTWGLYALNVAAVATFLHVSNSYARGWLYIQGVLACSISVPLANTALALAVLPLLSRLARRRLRRQVPLSPGERWHFASFGTCHRAPGPKATGAVAVSAERIAFVPNGKGALDAGFSILLADVVETRLVRRWAWPLGHENLVELVVAGQPSVRLSLLGARAFRRRVDEGRKGRPLSERDNHSCQVPPAL